MVRALHESDRSGRQVVFRLLALSLAATGLIAIGTLVFGQFDDTAGRILGTTGALAFFSLLTLPAGVLLDQDRHRVLAVGTITLAAFGLIAILSLVWRGGDESEQGWKLAASVTAFAVASAQAAAITSRRRMRDSQTITLLYWFATSAGLVLATLGTAAIWGEIEGSGYYRAVGALAVANVVAVLLQPTLRRLARTASSTRLVLAFDRAPSGEALDAALRALGPYGVRIERRT
jgi:hypothetical protein